jgi:hypothetical protein
MRVLRATIYTRVASSVAITVGDTPPAYAWAYDPANSGAFASVVGVLLTTQHVGPFALNNYTESGPLVENKSGYMKRVVKVPNPILPTAGASTANENVGSGWFATSDVSAVCGYWKGFVDGATSTVTGVDIFVIYDLEYRSRT